MRAQAPNPGGYTMYQQRTRSLYGARLTVLGRKVLITLLVMYIVQTILENWTGLPVIQTLAWWSPLSRFFRPWQPVTAFFLNGPSPISAMLSWLMIYFFFAPAEDAIGKKGLVRLFLMSWLAAVLLSFPLLAVGAIQSSAPYLGLHCFITAMIVVFGLSNPRATILLFFVLPIQASWIAWGTGLISFLFLLYGRDLASAVAFFGWVGATGYMMSGGSITGGWWRLRRWLLTRRRMHTHQRPEDILRALDGGLAKRGDDDDEGPLYH